MTSQKNPHYFEQTYCDGESSSFEESISKKVKGPRKGKESISQTSIKLETLLKSRNEFECQEEDDDEEFEFKYLKKKQSRRN